MNELMDVFKIAGLSVALMFINMILKQVGSDSAAKAVSIVGFITIALIVAKHILDFFQVVETMFMF